MRSYMFFPVGVIAEKAVCRSVLLTIWHQKRTPPDLCVIVIKTIYLANDCNKTKVF